ncbi:copper chaperone [Streptosporangium jomthongense]|uniref:Heavy-metal-associated domain-containing protein n=1 Tax=Marinobacter aromaticivorans TaxID=1494078 RepID=A0ABW2ISX4_9GAMM|nr:heavy-metal-associated domain-containing protein [Marinobacter aromaticivorans]GGE59065.1 copper chaperone [Streptosporangium jomthongense]
MKIILRSDELNCPSCVPKIEKALGQVAGVSHAKVHFATGRIEVEYDAGQVKTDQLVSAVRNVGYEARVSAF